ncbi:MAG: anion permease [Eubacteriales bacterium]|nr:anion permease [Eubacteriales bacterium]
MSNKKTLSRNLIILLSFLIIIGVSLIKPPEGLNNLSMRVLGIFLGCLLLWFTISIDWPSLLCILLIGFLPINTFKQVFAGSFGNETFVFLLCTFLCTYALSKTLFLKRCAIFFLTSKLAKKGSWYFVCLFFAAVLFIGSFISPTVLFVVFLPILEEIHKVLKIEKGEKSASMLMMGLAFCTSISSGMTPIAHVFSTMAMGFYKEATGEAISYASYMAFAIPIGVLCAIIMILLFRFVLNPDMSKLKNIDTEFLKKDLKKADKQEILCVLVFIGVILLWILPSFVKSIFPNFYSVINGYGTAMPPLIGAIVLCIISIDNKPLLNFSEGIKSVPWPALIMTAGTLTLGTAISSDDVLIKQFLADTLSKNLTGLAPIILVLVFTIWASIQTNLSSNMVTVTVVTNVAIPFLLANSGVNTAAVVCIIGMMSAFAFATPPSMPHIALTGSSGWTNVGQVFKYGGLLMIISIIITVFIGYPIASAII